MSKMGSEFIRTADQQAEDNEREVERLRTIINQAARAVSDPEHTTYLEWLAARCERMGWELSPPMLRAACAAIVTARAILAEDAHDPRKP